MIPKGKTRVTLTMSEELDNKVTMYAKAMGLTRGQLITSIVGQHILALDKSMEVIDRVGTAALKDMQVGCE